MENGKKMVYESNAVAEFDVDCVDLSKDEDTFDIDSLLTLLSKQEFVNNSARSIGISALNPLNLVCYLSL